MNNSANNTTSTQATSSSSGYSDLNVEPEKKTEEPVPEKTVIQEMYEGEPEQKTEEPEQKTEEPEQKTEEPEEEVKNPSTGYSENEPDNSDDNNSENKKPEEDSEKEIKEVLKELPESFDQDKVSKFAFENKMSKEQVEAYVKFAKEESDLAAKTHKEQIITQRKAWKQELQSDPTFGGENFDKNVHKVEKLMENHLPSWKKTLTERGGMLPPYIMKDLLGISKLLNPTTELVTGDPSKPKSEEKDNTLDIMYG